MKIISKSIGQTIALGEKLGAKLKKGSVVALVGDLGSGKTVFTKGIAQGLGVKNARYVNSPTFVIIKEYKGKMPLYHFDLYRLDHYSSFDAMNYEEYFYSDGVTVIEWADKIRQLLPKKYTEVRFSVAGEEKRKIEIL
ncbi:MAG: tRNA (adenosine(37)-N6)-threonylcarbamoyltransferase complex ATPase subunit type 1 TsaE [Candidatus Omnitrophota bacterium]|nr:tRNA (adenosine(37)-N6)-threonylcarbamoyltransferase complex ATPase subunit type 1 TsaE [Candidatus Omnitrophota bacterium]